MHRSLGRTSTPAFLLWLYASNVAAQDVLFVVQDPVSLSSQDSLRTTLIDSWGFVVTLIDDDASQAAFDSAAALNDVAYASEETPDIPFGTKLRGTSIGLVIEQKQSFDDIGFASNFRSDGDTSIEIVDNTHYITQPFALGSLTILSGSNSLPYLYNTNAGGLVTLAHRPAEPSKEYLAVIDVGGALFGGGTAAGRRVKLPWGNNFFDFADLNGSGELILRRSLEWASSASQSADLEVAKTVDDDTPSEGDTITYTVALTNNGPDSATNVDVTDALPAGVTYLSDTVTQGSYNSGTGIWTVGTVATTAPDTLTIDVTVDAGTAGSTIINTASVAAIDQTDPNPGNDSDATNITVVPRLFLVKTAFLPDGTPITSGDTVRRGQDLKYLIYINNTSLARTDLSIQDTLDVTFGYQAGTIKMDNSIANCAADTCTEAEESSIFNAVDAAVASTDAVDGDEVSYSSGSRTIDVGNESAANAQLDIAANRVWAILFTVKMQ
jgi:uncharacterized repeat protein (TIGR01451 family)